MDIQRLTGLSAIGNTISTTFQTTFKQENKTGDDYYSHKYDTKRGGKGAHIDLINTLNIKFACYIIMGKIMHHFSKNECTLDIILAVEQCIKGSQLNWCAFLLHELFEACEDVYKRETYFIYGYLFIAQVVWNLCPLAGQELAPIMKYQPLALKYTP